MAASFNFLSTIIAIPFIGLLFALAAKDDEKTHGRNVFNVSVFAIMTNLLVIWRMFALLDVSAPGLQMVERYEWLENPKISIVLGMDVFSLLLISAVHAAVLIGMFGARHNKEDGKALMVFSLMYVSMITGFFAAADIFSFYIFFEAMLLPLFMIIGMFGGIRKQGVLARFFIYNLLGAIFLFFATVILYNYRSANIALNAVSQVNLNMRLEIFVWGAIFVSFLSRIPIWPFHYWISSISTGLRNPLVFIITNVIPLTGVYGFVRFWPKTVPGVLSYFMIILEIVCVISMVFIALIGLINKDIQYKIFSFMTVGYIIYLLAAFLPTDMVLQNIGYSLFSFLIIAAGLEVLSNHLDKQQECMEISSAGILCALPRASLVFSFFVLAAVGMPLSSMFLNNFVLVADLLDKNIKMGSLVVFSLIVTASALLQELYRLKDNSCVVPDKPCAADISARAYGVLLLVCGFLLLTFVNPLWFVVKGGN